MRNSWKLSAASLFSVFSHWTNVHIVKISIVIVWKLKLWVLQTGTKVVWKTLFLFTAKWLSGIVCFIKSSLWGHLCFGWIPVTKISSSSFLCVYYACILGVYSRTISFTTLAYAISELNNFHGLSWCRFCDRIS